MFPQKTLIAKVSPENYPLDENSVRAEGGRACAMVALSHTQVERRLYAAMLKAVELQDQLQNPQSQNTSSSGSSGLDPEAPGRFTVRRVMELAGIASVTTIRRGLEGLVAKLSIERQPRTNSEEGAEARTVAYRVLKPEEVLARREQQGIQTFARDTAHRAQHPSFDRVIHRVLDNRKLSRREAQVAVCCVEGLTNAEIGSRLLVTEQTVKFHMRNIFLKFGVKRRAELITLLLL
jgi:DNA-binding CsgD family transcriptional regulator